MGFLQVSENGTAYMLIGLPGTGKSTFVSKLVSDKPNLKIISTDKYIDALAEERGISYTEAFKLVNLEDLETRALRETTEVTSGDDVVFDRTNLRVASRAKFLGRLSPFTRTIGVVFPVPMYEHHRRLGDRARTTGKSIPWCVLEHMRDSYEPPKVGEFDEVWVVDHLTGTASPCEDLL